MTGFSFDREPLHINLAWLKKGGIRFEIPIDSDKAIAFRAGENIDIKEIMHSPHIFVDAKKGQLAPEHHMVQLFGTSDPFACGKIILKEGEIQLTAEHRKRIRDAKLKQIIELVHRNGIDPKTKLPHPPQRIANAMDEAKIHVDEHKTVEQQLQDIIKKLRVVLPISFEVKSMDITVGTHHASRVYGILKTVGTIQKADWRSDGSLFCSMEIPAGLQNDLVDKLNALTHGQIDIKFKDERK
ncbi:ribosome assembly factor SBDS [Candidatus Woesearchaeota archaeon]|nr:ribosome assembly factor SBDS [Candidatus Woesearchaeota archaeon]